MLYVGLLGVVHHSDILLSVVLSSLAAAKIVVYHLQEEYVQRWEHKRITTTK
jgi:hypothetical protein